ncbi:MAG: hypothetical protein ABI398_02380 [Devosia sp.]
MRKSLLMLAALVPLAGLAAISSAANTPALANAIVADGSSTTCGATPAVAGPINLDQIPVKPIAGALSVRGCGDDDEDGGHEGRGHEGLGESARGEVDDD